MKYYGIRVPKIESINDTLSGAGPSIAILNSEFTSPDLLIGVEFYLAKTGNVHIEVCYS